MKPLIIYHDDMDGFVAALSYYLVLRDEAEYRAINYGDAAPTDVQDRPVAILDFSFDRATTEALWLATGQKLFVLDHHASAARNLQGLPYCQIDTKKSGAKLAFDHLVNDLRSMAELHKGDVTHDLIFRLEGIVKAVDDCDRYAHRYPESRPIYAALHSYDLDFELWRSSVLERGGPDLYREGLIVGRYRAQTVKKLIKHARTGKVTVMPYTVDVKVVNTASFQSDVGAALARDNPIAILWYQQQNGQYRYSLRSAPNGPDVEELAQYWGGGGHTHAAGFVTILMPDEIIVFDKVVTE